MTWLKGLLIAGVMFTAGAIVTLAVLGSPTPPSTATVTLPVATRGSAPIIVDPTTTPTLVRREALDGALFFLQLTDARQLASMSHAADDLPYLQWKRELMNQGRAFGLSGGTVVMVGRDIAPQSPSDGPEHFYEAVVDGRHGFIAAYNLR